MAVLKIQRAITLKVDRVMVHVFCTLPHSALYLCEVS